jgi:Tfp pilus assembly PilM family ATPase
VNALNLINPASVFIEIGQTSLKALDGDAGIELPLERAENGRLTDACRGKLSEDLRTFLKAQGWRPRPRAFCAVGARGVSLRRLTLPAASKEELQRLLPLQIESEFPLPPDQLAWGYTPVGSVPPPGNGGSALQELLVAAVRKETLNDYSQVLSGCGLNPVFTLGAIARSYLCRPTVGSYAVLDIGSKNSELVSFDNGVPSSIRIIQWGSENITQEIEKTLGLSHEEAERLTMQADQESARHGEVRLLIQTAIRAEAERLAGLIDSKSIGHKLYLAGDTARLSDFAPWLAAALGGSVECKQVTVAPGTGRSAAILGLKEAIAIDPGGSGPLWLQLARTRDAESVSPKVSWKWAALAAGLACGCLVLRYAEPMLFKPRLAKRIAEVKAYRQKLPQVDRDLNFLQYVRTNQPPHLDTLAIIANSAPGARLESFTLNRRGDVSLRASMRDAQQVTDFRSNLIGSGFFATVTVEEQAPSAADRQKISVRISGQLKPPNERKPLSIEAAPKDGEKSKAPPKDAKSSTSTNVTSSAAKPTGTSPSPSATK